MQQKNWRQVALPQPSTLSAYYNGALDPETLHALAKQATQAGGTLLRLSIRRHVPNIQMHWLLPDPKSVSARALFRDIREIGQLFSPRREEH